MHYYLSIGTNLEREHNACRITRELCENFGEIILLPFIETLPQQLSSENNFLNGLAVLHSDHSAAAVKRTLVTIETRLGRDRGDPLRSVKDRTADIDLLGGTRELTLDYFARCPEQYVRQVYLQRSPPVDLSRWGLPFAEGASRVRAAGAELFVERYSPAVD